MLLDIEPTETGTIILAVNTDVCTRRAISRHSAIIMMIIFHERLIKRPTSDMDKAELTQL